MKCAPDDRRSVDATRFNAVAAVGLVVGPAVALVAAVALTTPVAFTGSIALSAVVTLGFAGHNFWSVSRLGSVSFASASVAALLGAWLAGAPVVYDAGVLPTATTQFAGLVTATLGTHSALDVLGRAVSDRSSARGTDTDASADVPTGLGDRPDE